MAADRLAYDDADSAETMARDASACSAEAHLARAMAGVAAARRTVEKVPGTVLEAPAQAARAGWRVTESAATFAARLFD